MNALRVLDGIGACAPVVRPSNRSIPFGAKRLNRRKVPSVRGWVLALVLTVVPSVDQKAREALRTLRLVHAWNTREREVRAGAPFVRAGVPCR